MFFLWGRWGVMSTSQRTNEMALRVVARVKTANWWNTVLVRDEGGSFSVGVMGENPVGGWSGLSYMMKEVNGRIKKEADKVVKFLEAQGMKAQGGRHPTFGTQGRNNYVGWGFYGSKDPDVDLMKLLEDAKKDGVFNANLKGGYTGI